MIEEISIENKNLIPYTYRWNSNLFMFELNEKNYILIPLPHKSMKHNFLLEHHYENVQWGFRIMENNETMINFYNLNPFTTHLYNIFIEGKFIITELSKFSNMFNKIVSPNKEFTYLIAIPYIT